MCNVIPLAGPAATIVAAVAAVFVTWRLGKGQLRIAEQQAATARQQAELAAVRLQHDLFDRRFAVYEAARDLALEVLETADVSREGLSAFVRGTEKSVFLLDKELTDYLADMRKRAVNLQFAACRRDVAAKPGTDEARQRAFGLIYLVRCAV